VVFSCAHYDSHGSISNINLEIKGYPPHSSKTEATVLIMEHRAELRTLIKQIHC